MDNKTGPFICIDNAHDIMYTVSAISNVVATRKEVFIMAQTNLTIRIDEGIKQEAEILFSRIGLNMSSAINIFFRQAIREQSIPFELKPYDDYYTDENLARLKRSMAQSERGETISFSLSELLAMESGETSQRAIDFLKKHGGERVSD
jgi:DNA-damage-inducible protein J